MQKDPRSHAIIGPTMEVHRELGRGFLKPVYQCALALEFQDREIPFRAEVPLPVRYKGRLLTCADDARQINEVKTTGLQRGVLLNFGAPSLQFKRLVLTSSKNLRKSADNLEEIVL